jgi:hypothetical protein
VYRNSNAPERRYQALLLQANYPRFGQATANTNYPAWRPGFTGGRTYLLSGGIRF